MIIIIVVFYYTKRTHKSKQLFFILSEIKKATVLCTFFRTTGPLYLEKEMMVLKQKIINQFVIKTILKWFAKKKEERKFPTTE